jgi:hypothetical protein
MFETGILNKPQFRFKTALSRQSSAQNFSHIRHAVSETSKLNVINKLARIKDIEKHVRECVE